MQDNKIEAIQIKLIYKKNIHIYDYVGVFLI